MTREEVHYTLDAVYQTLLRLNDPATLEQLSTTTVHAIGEATGIVSKARALVGRDIDNDAG